MATKNSQQTFVDNINAYFMRGSNKSIVKLMKISAPAPSPPVLVTATTLEEGLKQRLMAFRVSNLINNIG